VTLYIQRVECELRRLRGELLPAQPGLATVRFEVQCRAEPADVLAKVKDVLARLDDIIASRPSTSDQNLAVALPAWFLTACAPEQTQQEAERWLAWWRTLPPEKQQEAEDAQPWSLPQWLHWMRPQQRTWYWFECDIAAGRELLLAVEVDGWPFPWGSLRWLFLAAGAASVAPGEA